MGEEEMAHTATGWGRSRHGLGLSVHPEEAGSFLASILFSAESVGLTVVVVPPNPLSRLTAESLEPPSAWASG